MEDGSAARANFRGGLGFRRHPSRPGKVPCRARSEHDRLCFEGTRPFVETLGAECGEIQGGRSVD
jgi:hypothetical protein